MSKSITASVTIERINEGGLIIDMATAHIEGQGVRCVCEVPSLGNRADAAAKAIRGALAKLGCDDEPAAYFDSQGTVYR